MEEERGRFQYAGLKFLFDMELVDEPQLVNHMKMNFFAVSKSIKDMEFLSSYHHKQMLIWLDVGWFGRKFFRDEIESAVLDRAKHLLPNFKFRVTTDRAVMNAALERVKEAMKGGNDGKVRVEPTDPSGSDTGPS